MTYGPQVTLLARALSAETPQEALEDGRPTAGQVQIVRDAEARALDNQ
jgi:hypothetical protein